MKRERRYLPHAEIRVRRGKNDDKPGIEGYAAVFNKLSEELGWGLREIIMPGAFSDCLKTDPDVRALINHDANLVIGRTKANTLRLKEDDKGLQFDCDTPDTQPARDLLTSIERGDMDQCSFGFYVRKQKWSEEEDENGEFRLIRELHAVDVFDVSAVTFPAYPQTSVDVRSLWPDGTPFRVRKRAIVLGRGATRQDEQENENGCECDCTNCQDDNCAGCTDVACTDVDCQSAGCPMQDQTPEANANLAPDAEVRRWMEARLRLAAN